MRCNGGINGSIVVNVTGNTAPYYVFWDNNVNTSLLFAGTYSYQIVDSIGCLYNNTLIVSEPDPFMVIENVSNVSCFGFNDGEIVLDVTGAIPPYVVNWFGVSNPNKTCFSLKVNVGHGGRGSTTGMSKSISHSQSSSPRQSLGLRETGRRRISNFGFVGAQVSTPVSSSTVLYETRTKSSRDKLMRFTHGGLGTGINISKSISKRHSPDSSHSGGVSVFVIAKRLGRIQLVSAYAVTTLNVRTNMFGHGTRGIGTTISRSTSNTHSSSTVSHDAPPGGARLTIRNILLIGQPTGLSLK